MGDTDVAPRMIAAGYGGIFLPLAWCKPIRHSVSRILHASPPSCSARPTNAVLIDWAVASTSVISSSGEL